MCLCVCFLIRAQDADFYRNQGEYSKAAVLYELDFYRTANDSSLLQKSQCYKQLGEYDQAIKALERIRQFDTYEEKALLHYLAGRHEESRLEILRMESFEMELSYPTKVLLVLIAISNEDIAEARKLTNFYNDDFGITEQELLNLYDDVKFKDPQKAFNVSLIAPGIGQWYAGHFGKGLVSGGIQAGIIAFSAWSLLEGYFYTGTLSGAALFYTFYLGGARYAKQLATSRNQLMVNTLKSDFIEKQKGSKDPL